MRIKAGRPITLHPHPCSKGCGETVMRYSKSATQKFTCYLCKVKSRKAYYQEKQKPALYAKGWHSPRLPRPTGT